MDAHRHRLRHVRRANDDRDRIVAERVAEDDKPRAHPRAERHIGFAGDGQRLRGLFAEARHRAGLDGDDRGIERAHRGRNGFGDQHRRQNLRELDQLDGRNRRWARRLRHEHMVRCGIGDQREDHVRIDIGHQFERNRLVGLDTERTRPPAGQDQARRDRRAKRAERREPLLIQPLDRQAEQRFVAAFDHHRPAGPELSQTPANAHLLTGSKQDGTCASAIIIWHRYSLHSLGAPRTRTPKPTPSFR